MKRTITILALLAMVATASATVRLFVTKSCDGYGLEDNAYAFTPTESTVYANLINVHGYDYADYYVPGPLRLGTYPPAGSPSGTVADPVVIDPPGQFAYIWLQFQSEPTYATINGLQITIREAGSTTPSSQVTTTYYLCNNRNNEIGLKRWDGTATPPGYPEWHNNPQTTFTTNGGYGIQNKAADLPWNLWCGGTRRITLLGSIQAPFDGTTYEILITDISYMTPPNPAVAGGAFRFMPEPTSLLLAGLAGLLTRRR